MLLVVEYRVTHCLSCVSIIGLAAGHLDWQSFAPSGKPTLLTSLVWPALPKVPLVLG